MWKNYEQIEFYTFSTEFSTSKVFENEYKNEYIHFGMGEDGIYRQQQPW